MELLKAQIKVRTKGGTVLDYNIKSMEDLGRIYETVRDVYRKELAEFRLTDPGLDFNKCNK